MARLIFTKIFSCNLILRVSLWGKWNDVFIGTSNCAKYFETCNKDWGYNPHFKVLIYN